jgi:hypothetical protein
MAGRATVGLAVLLAFSLSAAAASAIPRLHVTLTAPKTVAIPPSQFKVRIGTLPYRNAPTRQNLQKRSNTDMTVPTFSSSVVAGQDGNTYGFTIVGQNPFAGGAGTTTVTYQVIPVIVTAGGTGDVYDPTVANANCGEPIDPTSGLLTGPILKVRRWYEGATFVGDDQYIGASMREEFWSFTNRFGVSPAYHVRLSGTEPAVITATFNGGTEINAGTCNQLEEFPQSTWDSFIQGEFPTLAGFGVNSTTFPLFLFKNVVFTDSNGCCILGYHSAFNSGGNTQTYGNGDYVTDGEFGSTTDQAAISHETGEWANDPFVNNPTPSWGHIGQVSGCQGNLEVGDPLSGTVFPVNGNTTVGSSNPIYHMQELAFFGWFFDDNIGVNGRYSTRGTFTSGATLCS